MKKAQAMIISSIVLVVLVIVVISLFSSQLGLFFHKENIYDELKRESSNVGALLNGNSYPENWDENSVKKVGLLENNLVTTNSLRKFGSLHYSKTKMLLGIKRDYIFYFTNNTNELKPIQVENREFWGWNGGEGENGGTNLNEALVFIFNLSQNIAKDERFVTLNLNGTVMNAVMVSYVWDFVPQANLTLIPYGEFFKLHHSFEALLLTVKDVYTTGESINLTGS